jgi:signal transduction histidine kinase
MSLQHLLTSERGQVLARWKELVLDGPVPESLPPPELLDHMPSFLEGLAVAIAREGNPDTPIPRIAEQHGRQRLRLGFSLDAIVHEYGALQSAILAVAKETGEDVDVRELDLVFQHVIAGIAHAVSEYTRQRDSEFQRQANEHFAFVAHELRNPLFIARTALDVLREGGALPEDDPAVEALQRSLRGTSELIDETLHNARVGTGIEVHRRWIDLKDLVDDMESSSRLDAEAKGQELRIEMEGDTRLLADPRLVRSAVGNLLQNAVKYTPPGGLVELRVKGAGDRVRIEVEDCCGGLPPGKVEEVFTPFVRLDRTQSGFGLGLAISRQAAEAHGGSVRVQNLPTKGCMFVLELPVAEDGAPRR